MSPTEAGLLGGREFLKCSRWREWEASPTDQRLGLPHPPLGKPTPPDARLYDLVPPEETRLGAMPVAEAMARRRSRRRFTPEPLSLDELSFLLWATQGVHEVFRGGLATRRVVPSGGARHPFETYLLINRVTDLGPGLYRYLALDHKLCFLRSDDSLAVGLEEACMDQGFASKGAVAFIWSVVPYRTEWRYTIVSPKIIALDAGHVCQNLYLACEAIGAGTCAIGAYDQGKLDTLLGLDGQEEFSIYVAPVGKVAE